jgi:hypothetical protein
MPYLMRRAHENSAMTKGPSMGKELRMLRTELWRRLRQLGSGGNSRGQGKVQAAA